MMRRRNRVWVVAPVLLLVALGCSGPEAGPTPVPSPASTPTSTPAPETTVPTPAPLVTPSPQPTGIPSSRTPAGPPPKLDTSVASVPLEDIVFDTFSGGFVRLSEAGDSDIERLRDAIMPIYEPNYEPVAGGRWLADADLVIGYVSESRAFAYPLKILNFHEIANDVIDGVPVLVSYCPLCASGVVYDRVLDGRVLVFLATPVPCTSRTW